MLLDGLIERWGPLALYSDRHAVFKHNARPPETIAEATQFTRGLQELGIRQIFARSPHAKGRVERMAETFQDRLGHRTAPGVRQDHWSDHGGAAGLPAALQRPFRRAAGASGSRLPSGGPRPVSFRNPVLQAHPQGRPGQHGEVPLAGPATAAGSGTSQLRRTAGGGAGTPRQRTHRPVSKAYRGHAGTTAADGRTVGCSQPLVARP